MLYKEYVDEALMGALLDERTRIDPTVRGICSVHPDNANVLIQEPVGEGLPFRSLARFDIVTCLADADAFCRELGAALTNGPSQPEPRHLVIVRADAEPSMKDFEWWRGSVAAIVREEEHAFANDHARYEASLLDWAEAIAVADAVSRRFGGLARARARLWLAADWEQMPDDCAGVLSLDGVERDYLASTAP